MAAGSERLSDYNDEYGNNGDGNHKGDAEDDYKDETASNVKYNTVNQT